jgi:hypothetical protein
VHSSSREFKFAPFEPVKVKGYDALVTFFFPQSDTRQAFMREVIEKMDLFTYLTPMEQRQLAQTLKMETYAEGDPIIVQGTEAESFFVIIEGQVVVTQVDANKADATPTTLTTLSRGRQAQKLN